MAVDIQKDLNYLNLFKLLEQFLILAKYWLNEQENSLLYPSKKCNSIYNLQKIYLLKWKRLSKSIIKYLQQKMSFKGNIYQ